MKILRSAILACTLFIMSLSAQAISIQLDFTAAGFGAGAPDDPVSGSFVYDAASTTSMINSVVSIDLTIAGHSYTLGEIGSTSFSPFNVIAGLVNSVTGIGSSTTDFFMGWDFTTMASPVFSYATASSNRIFDASSFSQFSISEVTAMPEPGTLSLLAIGLASIAWVRRRKIV